MLPDREAGTLAAWLRAHPGTGVICRDRAGAFADGARAGAPAAIQADRPVAPVVPTWPGTPRRPSPTATGASGTTTPPPGKPPPRQGPGPGQLAAQAAAAHAGSRARVVRARQRYEQVQAPKDAGKNVTTIMRELRLAPGTARRYYRAASAG
jgi:hypothetical protein